MKDNGFIPFVKLHRKLTGLTAGQALLLGASETVIENVSQRIEYRWVTKRGENGHCLIRVDKFTFDLVLPYVLQKKEV